MVLSGGKKTSSISSIINRNSGGGSKKAGLPPSVAKDSHASTAHIVHQSSKNSTVLKTTRNPTMNLVYHHIIR